MVPQTWNLIQNKGLEGIPKTEKKGLEGAPYTPEEEPGGDTADRHRG